MRGTKPITTLLALTMIGCGASIKSQPMSQLRQTQALLEKPVVALSQNSDPAPDAPKDAQPAVPIVFRLQAYQLRVPVGTISRNDAFWKRIDEHCLDVLSTENLQRNGLRVGVAPLSEWEYLNNLIQQNPGTASRAETVGRDAHNIELEMSKGMTAQTIYFFDMDGTGRGRSFDGCNNIINLCYEPTPRKPGSARLSLAPMVRSTRKHLEFSPANNEERAIIYRADESFYLNIIVDVPANHVLVLAPSPDARNETSLGNRFLIQNEPAEQFEQVILVFPRPTRVDAP